MKKKFMLRETGRSTRVFESFEAADKAMEERVEYYLGRHALITRMEKNRFEFFLDGEKFFISIKEFEVEG